MEDLEESEAATTSASDDSVSAHSLKRKDKRTPKCRMLRPLTNYSMFYDSLQTMECWSADFGLKHNKPNVFIRLHPTHVKNAAAATSRCHSECLNNKLHEVSTSNVSPPAAQRAGILREHVTK